MCQYSFFFKSFVSALLKSDKIKSGFFFFFLFFAVDFQSIMNSVVNIVF